MTKERFEVTCPTCGDKRTVGREAYWHITSPKGRSSGDCKSCSLRKKTYPGRKNPGGIKLHDPFANSLFKSRIYGIWSGMRNRCQNPNNVTWPHYGGRGISVCERWESFEAFVEDMYPTYVPGLTIERIDNEGNYEPSNCRWASKAEQSLNTRRNRWLTYNGYTMTTTQWGRELGLNRTTIEARLKRGESPARALRPVH